MPFLIGQCCTDQISGGGGSGSGDASAKNEPILFDALLAGDNEIVIPWNATRKAKFGDAGVFHVEIYNAAISKYVSAYVDVVPDSINNTTKYTFNITGPVSGRITIT